MSTNLDTFWEGENVPFAERRGEISTGEGRSPGGNARPGEYPTIEKTVLRFGLPATSYLHYEYFIWRAVCRAAHGEITSRQQKNVSLNALDYSWWRRHLASQCQIHQVKWLHWKPCMRKPRRHVGGILNVTKSTGYNAGFWKSQAV